MDKELVNDLIKNIVNDCQWSYLTIGDETYFKADAVIQAIKDYFEYGEW